MAANPWPGSAGLEASAHALTVWRAGEEGFEPSHAGIKIRCLNQLGDSPIVSGPRKNEALTRVTAGQMHRPPANKPSTPLSDQIPQGMAIEAAGDEPAHVGGQDVQHATGSR